MEQKTFEIGPIRPPFHANSLLLRITENCTWNKCNFCTLYRDGKFKMRHMDDVKKDIDNVAYYVEMIEKNRSIGGDFDMEKIMFEYNSLIFPREKDCYATVFNWMRIDNMENVFLQDANTMVIKPQNLGEIVAYLKNRLPGVKLIAAYGRADTLAKITNDEFVMLKKSGLNMLHSGFESGCREVLEMLNKGCTPEEQIAAGLGAKKAGMEFNVFYMPGAGGRTLSSKNAIETAEVINAINPDYVRIRTFVIKEGSPMWDMKKRGEFDECTDIEKVLELREMLNNIKNCNGYIVSDHIINLLPKIEGYFDKDLKSIFKYIDDFLSLSKTEQRRYQLIRRMTFGGSYKDMDYLKGDDMLSVVRMEQEITDAEKWEELMRKYLRNYI